MKQLFLKLVTTFRHWRKPNLLDLERHEAEELGPRQPIGKVEINGEDLPVYNYSAQDSFDEFIEAIEEKIQEIHEDVESVLEQAYSEFMFECDYYEQDVSDDHMAGRRREFQALINRYRREYNPFPESFDFLIASKKPFASNLERRTAKVLRSLGINFKSQVRFDGCRQKLPLPFDFGFVIDNQRFLVECDGRQHFEPVGYLGGQEAFDQLKERDSIKSAYCTENEIVLIRIPYTMKNSSEMIESEILNSLNGAG